MEKYLHGILRVSGVIVVEGANDIYEVSDQGMSSGDSLPWESSKEVDTTMEEDEIKGKGKQIKGQVREEVGKLTGDKTEQVKGKMEQAEGKVQEEYGKLKGKAKDLAEDHWQDVSYLQPCRGTRAGVKVKARPPIVGRFLKNNWICDNFIPISCF